MKCTNKHKDAWVRWLDTFGSRKFLESFLRNVENAESTCTYCSQKIYVDVMIGGGVPDWSTEDGDFGCEHSPDTNNEGVGGHMPKKRGGGLYKTRRTILTQTQRHKQKDGKHELSNDIQTANGDNRRTDYETSTRQQGATGERAQPVRKDATEGQAL